MCAPLCRSQAYIELELYEDALRDAEQTLR